MEKIFNPVLQARTREYMEATGTSQAELARRLGMTNSSTLSRWLNSSYSGDVEKVERSLEEYFRVQSEADKAAEKAAPYRPAGDYVPTSISEDVYQSIKYCQLHRCVTVLHGDAGVGKTKGAQKFLRENPSSTIYISVTPSTSNLNGVIRLLARALKIPERGNKMDLMLEIRERLANTNKVVIVDEAQFLKLPAIEELRTLSDMDSMTGTPGNGVCLIGNSQVYDRIQGKAQAEFAQTFTRVKMPRHYLASRITLEDVKKLFPALNGEKELSFLLGIARSVYSIRTAQNIYENAIGLDDVSYNGLRKVAAAMDVRVA